MPNLESLLQTLGGSLHIVHDRDISWQTAQYYWQIALHESSQEFSSIETPLGIYYILYTILYTICYIPSGVSMLKNSWLDSCNAILVQGSTDAGNHNLRR